RESANYIGARSFRAAIKPDIKLQPTVDVRTMDAFANGMRSYNIYEVCIEEKCRKYLDIFDTGIWYGCIYRSCSR
ncbi:hypothetical protein, partial [Escherichia coli]|uniref:hypothetical protein n=1 Tax=Escherichia coli TaxID=562 RepID=UPI001BDCE0D4